MIVLLACLLGHMGTLLSMGLENTFTLSQEQIQVLYDTNAHLFARSIELCEETLFSKEILIKKKWQEVQASMHKEKCVNVRLAQIKDYFEEVASQDSDTVLQAEARAYLGLMYFRGLGLIKNCEIARIVLEKAINFIQSEYLKAEVAYCLGLIYYNGWETAKDYVKAQIYFELVCKQNVNNPIKGDASSNLGVIFYRDFRLTNSHMYFMEAQKLECSEHTKAQTNLFLGKFSYYGYGPEIDYVRAKHYFELAANQEVNLLVKQEACLYLGIIYFSGLTQEVDCQRAWHYFKYPMDAYYLEQPEIWQEDNCLKALACAYVGVILFKGPIDLRDLLKARKYFTVALKQNSNKEAAKFAETYIKYLDPVPEQQKAQQKYSNYKEYWRPDLNFYGEQPEYGQNGEYPKFESYEDYNFVRESPKVYRSASNILEDLLKTKKAKQTHDWEKMLKKSWVESIIDELEEQVDQHSDNARNSSEEN